MNDINFVIERNILKIGNQILNIRNDDLKSYSLTSNQSETLLYFDARPGALIIDLKDYLKVSHQAARNLIERMKEKDLLYVEVSDEDARAKKVFLTEKGIFICRKLKEKGSNLGKTILSSLDNGEKEALLFLLEKIISGL